MALSESSSLVEYSSVVQGAVRYPGQYCDKKRCGTVKMRFIQHGKIWYPSVSIIRYNKLFYGAEQCSTLEIHQTHEVTNLQPLDNHSKIHIVTSCVQTFLIAAVARSC